MDNDSKPETPSVFTEDPSSTLVIHIDEHKEFVLAAPLASPISHSRAQPSNTSVTPPSFTLSTQPSVHFATTKANQDNKPDCGATSLALIEPNDPPRPHARRPSDATGSNTEEGTAAGYPPTTTCPTCNTTISVKSVVETHNLPTPTHVGSISEIGKSESQMRDHQKSGKKLGGDAQTGSGGNKDTTKVQGGPSLFSRLCGVRVDSPSFIPRIRQSSIPKDDRVTL